jgi:hypothetical protein
MSRELSDLVVHRAGFFGKWLMFPKGRWRSRKEEKPISPLTLSSTSYRRLHVSVNDCLNVTIV